jgi:thiosulfate/3-mercaptopyruvate sulfurtransferase
MSGFARPELLATTDWLADQLGRPEVRVVDARWRPDGTAKAAFAAGHIAGATHVDWREDLSESGGEEEPPGLRLAPPEKIVAVMDRAGVGDATSLVLYDDTLGLHAARVWWSLRVYGFESARILDGGLPAWQAEGRPLSTASLPVARAAFRARLNPRLRLTTADVRALLGSPEVQVLDARAHPEYRGFEGNAKRLGHIPGAINVPVGALHDAGSQRLRDPELLQARLVRAGVARGRRLVCYDGTGIAAARLAHVLTTLGYDDVAVYDGGWAEWGDRLDLPVER